MVGGDYAYIHGIIHLVYSNVGKPVALLIQQCGRGIVRRKQLIIGILRRFEFYVVAVGRAYVRKHFVPRRAKLCGGVRMALRKQYAQLIAVRGINVCARVFVGIFAVEPRKQLVICGVGVAHAFRKGGYGNGHAQRKHQRRNYKFFHIRSSCSFIPSFNSSPVHILCSVYIF